MISLRPLLLLVFLLPGPAFAEETPLDPRDPAHFELMVRSVLAHQDAITQRIARGVGFGAEENFPAFWEMLQKLRNTTIPTNASVANLYAQFFLNEASRLGVDRNVTKFELAAYAELARLFHSQLQSVDFSTMKEVLLAWKESESWMDSGVLVALSESIAHQLLIEKIRKPENFEAMLLVYLRNHEVDTRAVANLCLAYIDRVGERGLFTALSALGKTRDVDVDAVLREMLLRFAVDATAPITRFQAFSNLAVAVHGNAWEVSSLLGIRPPRYIQLQAAVIAASEKSVAKAEHLTSTVAGKAMVTKGEISLTELHTALVFERAMLTCQGQIAAFERSLGEGY